jgi:hypothetical protein
MTRSLIPVIVTGLVCAACASAPTEVRAKVAQFQKQADAGRFDEIRPEGYKPGALNFEQAMQLRRGLGHLVNTSEATSDDVTGYVRVVAVSYNSEFERGRGLEQFFFRMDDAEPVLVSYGFHVGKKMECPKLQIVRGQCEIVSAS